MKHESVDCRRDARRPTYITGRVRIGADDHPCWIRDLSAGGALLFAELPIKQGDRLVLEVNDRKLAAYVRWTDYPLVGVQFEEGSMVQKKGVQAQGSSTSGRQLREGLQGGASSTTTERLRRWWNGE